MERHLATGVATIVALMVECRTAFGKGNCRSTTLEDILFDADGDLAADNVVPRDVVGDWLVSLPLARHKRG